MHEIPLRAGAAAWVDAATFLQFGHLKWRLHSSGFPCRDGQRWTGRPGIILLPRLIVGAHAGQSVTTKNNIKLDCRRENLVVEPKPRRRGHEAEDLSAIVLRFLRAFPQQYRFGTPLIRMQLKDVREETGLTAEELLHRIDGWAADRANIAPWTLATPAPVLHRPTEEVRPSRQLPAASPETLARVRAVSAPWASDGTV